MNSNITKRKDERSPCFVRVLYNGHPGQIRDINSNGLKASLMGRPQMETKEVISLTLIPDDSLGLPHFSINGYVRWTREGDISVVIGFELSGENPDSELFEKLRNKWF